MNDDDIPLKLTRFYFTSETNNAHHHHIRHHHIFVHPLIGVCVFCQPTDKRSGESKRRQHIGDIIF